MRKLPVLTTSVGFLLTLLVAGCGTQSVPSTNSVSQQPQGNSTSNQTTADTNNSVSVSGTDTSVGKDVSAGLSLSKQHPGPLVAVSFATPKVGFVASQKAIYKTTDGGGTWVKVYDSSDAIQGLTTKYGVENGKSYIWATAWTNKRILGTSPNGSDFSSLQTLSHGAIQDVSQLPGDMVAYVSEGTVWYSAAAGDGWFRAPTSKPVSSIATVNQHVFYAVTSDGTVYKTTNAGKRWINVFTTKLGGDAPWKTSIKVKGKHVAVLFYGGDAGLSNVAYILYESNDSGRTWNALVDQGYFSGDYNGAKPLDQANAGGQPGPFALDSQGTVFLTGLDMSGPITELTVISPDGKVIAHGPIGSSGYTPNVFDGSPSDITTPDGTHLFVVGGKNRRGVMENSPDGGLTWKP